LAITSAIPHFKLPQSPAMALRFTRKCRAFLISNCFLKSERRLLTVQINLLQKAVIVVTSHSVTPNYKVAHFIDKQKE